ncbi:MAG: heme exporter protein CcmD [Proteobacteria bacterium]|nr:heme exporter protein CcmD [Pseudomonadota bacterium]
MTYLPYIVGAYSVFGVVLAWDGLTPWLRHRRTLRAIRRKGERAAAKNKRRDGA